MTLLEEKVEYCLGEVLKQYPELSRSLIGIHFKRLRKTTMATRPVILSLLLPKHKWRFTLSVYREGADSGRLDLETLSEDALKGILGHELAHIVQYKKMSRLGLLCAGFLYGISTSFRKHFEREADMITIHRNLRNELKETRKEQLRTDRSLSFAYQAFIKNECLSVEEIEKV